MSLSIRPIRVDDFADVLRINAESVPYVAKLDERELDRLVALAALAWVAESTAGGVCGYLLAMSSADDYDGEEFRCFQQKLNQPFTYIDQMTIDFGARRTKIGSRMYERLTRWSHEHNRFVLCCEVNVRPPNPISMRFHETVGFEPLGELETSDGRMVAMLRKHLPLHTQPTKPAHHSWSNPAE